MVCLSAPDMELQPCVRFSISIQQPKLNPSFDPLIIKQEEATTIVKRQRILNFAEPTPQRWLPLPLRYRRSLQSAHFWKPVFIFNRKLYESDVNPGQMRLAMPRTQILNTFLTDREEEIISSKDSHGKMNKIQVLVLDPALKLTLLSLTRWNYKSSTNWSYVLGGRWNEIVTSNGFNSGDEINVWAYRMHRGYLGMTIEKVLPDLNGDDRGLVWGRKRKRGSKSSNA